MLLAAGCWLLVAGCWLLVAGCWLLACRLSPFLILRERSGRELYSRVSGKAAESSTHAFPETGE
jgi:hypothetical protein